MGFQFNLYSGMIVVRAPISMDNDEENHQIYCHLEYLVEKKLHELQHLVEEFDQRLTVDLVL